MVFVKDLGLFIFVRWTLWAASEKSKVHIPEPKEVMVEQRAP